MKIECVINEKMKWIICCRCDRAVPSEYLQTHLWTKHKIDCSNDQLNSIVIGNGLMLLDSIRAWKRETVTLAIGIGGIGVETGHKCIKCEHYTPVWESMTEHFRINHEGKDAKEWTEADVQM